MTALLTFLGLWLLLAFGAACASINKRPHPRPQMPLVLPSHGNPARADLEARARRADTDLAAVLAARERRIGMRRIR